MMAAYQAGTRRARAAADAGAAGTGAADDVHYTPRHESDDRD